jgi:hypothetical protein
MNKKDWGLGIGAIAALAVGSSLFYNVMHSGARNDSVREQSVFDTKKKENLEDKVQGIMVHDGVRIDVYSSDVAGKHKGFNLEIDTKKRSEWLQYVPLTCEVPGLDYSAPLPIEDGLKSAKLTLKNPENLFGETLYIVGTDRSGRAVKLYEFKLGEPRGK